MIILTGLLFTIAFTFIISLSCGGIALFIDSPSLIVIIIPLIFFCCITKIGRTIVEYIKSSFKKNYLYSVTELDTISTGAKNLIKITLALGGIGFFAGIIATLANMSDPSLIGPFFAISLLTVYYSFAISYFIFFPLQVWAENRAKPIK